jgi:hypothetical protein
MQLNQLRHCTQTLYRTVVAALHLAKILRRLIISIASILLFLRLWFFSAFFESYAGEVAGALVSLSGGLVGAGAAVGAVFLLIWRQTADEAEKVAYA